MTSDFATPLPETDPGNASAEGGFVVLDGPDGVAVTMTANAALLTGERLIAAARLAQSQASDKGTSSDA